MTATGIAVLCAVCLIAGVGWGMWLGREAEPRRLGHAFVAGQVWQLEGVGLVTVLKFRPRKTLAVDRNYMETFVPGWVWYETQHGEVGDARVDVFAQLVSKPTQVDVWVAAQGDAGGDAEGTRGDAPGQTSTGEGEPG